jgi:hypothetical protein
VDGHHSADGIVLQGSLLAVPVGDFNRPTGGIEARCDRRIGRIIPVGGVGASRLIDTEDGSMSRSVLNACQAPDAVL